MIAPRSSSRISDIPRLHHGDRLSAKEFCRRWDVTPELKHAELLGGQVYMNPPISAGSHGRPQYQVLKWLGTYEDATDALEVIGEASVHFGPQDLPQPDAILRIKDSFGGMSRMKRRELYGAPELIVEVAASSAAYDLFVKKERYAKHGVQEYLVWIVHDRKFAWWTLESGDYVRLEQERNGVIKSLVFPGLWLDTKGMLANNWPKTLTTLQNGLASPEYHEFVKSMAARGRKKRKS